MATTVTASNGQPVAKEYDLSTYKDLLEDDFSPIKYANQLILSTNNLYVSQLNSLSNAIYNEGDSWKEGDGATDAELDLITAIKKVSFSIKDVSDRIARISSRNYDGLIGEFEKIEQFQSGYQGLQASIFQLNQLMGVLQSEFLQNYEGCQKYIQRLQNLHFTYCLINELILFLDGLKKFNSSFKAISFTDTNVISDVSDTDKTKSELESTAKSLVRASLHFFFLNQILQKSANIGSAPSLKTRSNNTVRESSRILSSEDAKFQGNGTAKDVNLFKQLKIIKNFNIVYKIEKIDRINNYCLELLKTDQIVNAALDTNNTPSDETAGGSVPDLITCVVITLMIFNTNDSLIEIFNCYYRYEVNYATNLLKKILISPKNFDASMVRVSHKSQKLLKVIQVLSGLKLLSYNTSSNLIHEDPFAFLRVGQHSKEFGSHNLNHNSGNSGNGAVSSPLNLNTFIVKNLSIAMPNSSLFTNFYRDVAILFEEMISKTLAKGGPVAKNLKMNYGLISNSIKKRVVENSCEFHKVNEKSLEVIMMVNSIRKLNVASK